MMPVFGPVPSRRLGRSLGINNIPPKHCTYACVYCQLGSAQGLTAHRLLCYAPERLIDAVKTTLDQLRRRGETVDYLTIVSDGEPTLDNNLGLLLRRLSELDIKSAVITNGSLLAHPDVQNDLMSADWISVKVDSVSEPVWRRINRPHGTLKLDSILSGIEMFAARFPGTLATETMLVRDLNDSGESLTQTAAFIGTLRPAVSYLSVPTRPPAERWVLPPSEKTLGNAWKLFNRRIPVVEYLIGYEGNAFSSTGDLQRDLLSITAVHPMRKEAVAQLIKKTDGDWETVDRLISSGLIRQNEFSGETYYSRTLRAPGNDPALGIRTQ